MLNCLYIGHEIELLRAKAIRSVFVKCGAVFLYTIAIEER